jgi:hypothetical protein
MNTKTNGLLSVLFGGMAFVAFMPFARAQSWGSSDHRHGTIVVRQKAVRAIATGPTLLHVYADTSGGTIFVTPFAAGGDGDCSGPAADALSRAAPLTADRVLILSVGPGEVACLETTSDKWFELMWHARPLPDPRS